ncbi:hypothetical protein GCM10027159_15600 [Lysobacter terrae]
MVSGIHAADSHAYPTGAACPSGIADALSKNQRQLAALASPHLPFGHLLPAGGEKKSTPT